MQTLMLIIFIPKGKDHIPEYENFWFFFWLFLHYFYQSATGVYLAALPTPGGIQIAGKTPNDGSYEQHISHMQKKINDTIAKNKELYEINPPVSKISLHCE